ncbi:hypothetical protein YC2023_036870 [Brassica napus]
MEMFMRTKPPPLLINRSILQEEYYTLLPSLSLTCSLDFSPVKPESTPVPHSRCPTGGNILVGTYSNPNLIMSSLNAPIGKRSSNNISGAEFKYGTVQLRFVRFAGQLRIWLKKIVQKYQHQSEEKKEASSLLYLLLPRLHAVGYGRSCGVEARRWCVVNPYRVQWLVLVGSGGSLLNGGAWKAQGEPFQSPMVSHSWSWRNKWRGGAVKARASFGWIGRVSVDQKTYENAIYSDGYPKANELVSSFQDWSSFNVEDRVKKVFVRRTNSTHTNKTPSNISRRYTIGYWQLDQKYMN